MKRCLCALILAAMLLANAAVAEGFFPTTDALFGVTMPSVAFALGRQPTSEKTEDGATVQTFSPFDDADYEALNRYLAGTACRLTGSTVDDAVVCTLEKDGAEITFTYDREHQTATVTYPRGTRVEIAAGAPGEGNVLPTLGELFGAGLPTLAPVLGEGTPGAAEDGTVLTYTGVFDGEYAAVSRYLAACGCALERWEVEGDTFEAALTRDGGSFTLRFDSAAHTVEMAYHTLSHFDDPDYADDAGAEGLLPSIDEAFGYIPSIVTGLGKPVDESGQTANGGSYELFRRFTDDDYAAFSQYLQQKHCSVTSYKEQNGVIYINLEHFGAQFDLEYDRLNGTMKEIFHTGARSEPTPEPTPEPEPTPKPAEARSETTCWRIAEDYFKNLSWKDPSSLQIHGHTSSWKGNQVTFIIDYSAKNGFGGYNRGTYYIVVNATTGEVVYAFGS